MQRLLSVMILCTLVLGASSIALGAGQENHAAEGEAHAESIWTSVFRWINFAVLAGGLILVLRRPLGDFFRTRSEEIREGIERSQVAEREAAARISEIEKKLGTLSSDIARLRSEMDREASAEAERVLAEGAREVEAITRQAREELRRAAIVAERDLRERLAERVVMTAQQRLQGTMTSDDLRRSVDRFIESLKV